MIKMVVIFCLAGVSQEQCTPDRSIFRVDGPAYDVKAVCVRQAAGFKSDAEVKAHIARIRKSLAPLDGMAPPTPRLTCIEEAIS